MISFVYIKLLIFFSQLNIQILSLYYVEECINKKYLLDKIMIKFFIFIHNFLIILSGSWWSWSYGSWFYNYLCNQCLSPLTLWVLIPLSWGVLDTTLCDKVCQTLVAGRWFSPGTPRYNWNIVESDVKHHKPNQTIILSSKYSP
jgi:hypothetical protein